MFGSYLFLLLLNYDALHKAVLTLCKYYKSKVIGFYIGPFPTIVANDYESVKELLYQRDLDGRPDIFVARMRDPNENLKGIFFTEGLGWRDQRRFILRHLRDQGFGCRATDLECEIRDEVNSFMELLKGGPVYPHEQQYWKDGCFNVPEIFHAFLVNCFVKILCGERIPRKDQHILFDTAEHGMLFQKSTDDYGTILTIIPWLRYFFPNASNYNNIKKGNSGVYRYIKSIIDRHIETYDERYERNMIDLYIKEMKQAEKDGLEASTFNCKPLIDVKFNQTLIELFFYRYPIRDGSD